MIINIFFHTRNIRHNNKITTSAKHNNNIQEKIYHKGAHNIKVSSKNYIDPTLQYSFNSNGCRRTYSNNNKQLILMSIQQNKLNLPQPKHIKKPLDDY